MTFEEKRTLINELIECYSRGADDQERNLLLQALQADALFTICNLLQKEEVSQSIKDVGSKLADALGKSK